MIEAVLFWGLAAAAVASALGVVALQNPVGSVMALLAAMLATAGLYALMGAVVVALFQLIVYIGAVLVLFLFVVMLLDLKASAAPARAAASGAAGVGITAAAGWAAWVAASHAPPAGSPRPAPGVFELAIDLFGRHLLVFELTSVLLLAAAVGAIFISRTGKRRSS
ncbi:MAG TPA: NADH-quinone oxidoreductase subunit J [Syntrophales bacterium]|nr:NADH-quinone oxidoreductase subunit J [Syntrophales bacterium]